MKRRTFIYCLLGTASTGLSALYLNRREPLADFGARPEAIVTRSGFALGTTITITACHPDAKHAGLAIDEAFAAIDHVESLMSLYRPDSQLAQLNRNSRLKNPAPELLGLIERSLQLSRQTKGAFDITVQPLWDLYAACAERGTSPTQSERANALAKVDWQQLHASAEEIRLSLPGAAITLNGIAQGFAADAACDALKSRGIRNALLDTGEFRALGHHPQRENWNIGIKDPRQSGHLAATAAMADFCLATSGDYETRFSSDYSSHHLIDPKTGLSSSDLASVTVAAPSATEADALSTAAFLLGSQEGRTFIAAVPSVEALFITKSGQRIQTSHFPVLS